MKLRKRVLILMLIIISSPQILLSQGGKTTISGRVYDASTGDPLPGATVIIKGTTTGAMAGIDGSYSLQVSQGSYSVECSFVSYQSVTSVVTIDEEYEVKLDFRIAEALNDIEEVVVYGKANRENETTLLLERRDATLSIESIGARELSRKGASDVEEGVTKVAGISSMGSKQIFVRGLGDRYNNAMLNGMPIPSGDPARKVIDLSIIPSRVVQKVDVTKVFAASGFADFSGANIDITTRQYLSEDFLQLDFGSSFNTLTVGHPMKLESGLTGFKSYTGFNSARYRLPSEIGPVNHPGNDLSSLLYDPFLTDFSYKTGVNLPAFSLGLSGGKSIPLGKRNLSLLFAGSFRNRFDFSYGSKRFLELSGGTIYDYDTENWVYGTNSTALVNMVYPLRQGSNIFLNTLFINNSDNSIEENFGYHSTNDGIIKARRYMYENNRVLNILAGGKHYPGGAAGRISYDWKVSYSLSNNESPDRRDLTWNYDPQNGVYYLRRENIANYRTFIDLREQEISGSGAVAVRIGDADGESGNGTVSFGIQSRIKTRDFGSRDFFYTTRNLTGVHDPETPASYLSDQAIMDGTLSISEGTALSNYYLVYKYSYAAYINLNYNLSSRLVLDMGLRGESSDQFLYFRKSPERTTFSDPWIISETRLSGLHPALNLKYSTGEKSSLKLSASRTVSEPLFTELGPFVNRGMYGEYSTFGNPDLKSSRNYNMDLRFETFPSSSELASITLYGKYIDDPIEKYYKASSSKLVSWTNSKSAVVAGFELELRKNVGTIFGDGSLLSGVTTGFNFAYLYSRIEMGEESGVNTNSVRPLQGASPYLVNADITFPFASGNTHFTGSVVYQVSGKRIYAVGTDGRDDIYEMPFHSLDLLMSAEVNSKLSINLGMKNMLNRPLVHTIAIDGDEITVDEVVKGLRVSTGISYKF